MLRNLLFCIASILLLLCSLYFPGSPFTILSQTPSHEFLIAGTLIWLFASTTILVLVWNFKSKVDLPKFSKLELLTLGCITTLAALFRFWQLETLPLDMTSDHVEKLLDVHSVLEGARPVFFSNNGGREPLEFYLLALMHRLGMPLDFMSLKILMGIVSTITIPLFYVWARDISGGRFAAIGALLLAVSAWHIQITRIGLRIAFAPLFLILTLIPFFRALEHKRRNDWLLSGLLLGLGMYGYTGFRPIIIFIPLAVLIYHCCEKQNYTREHFRHFGWAMLLAILVTLPLIHFAVLDPTHFWHRTLSRAAESEREFQNSALWQFTLNFKNALLMFNITSDNHWFHNPRGYPALGTLNGVCFALGIIWLMRLSYLRDWKALLVLLAIPCMLVASAMSLAFPNEVPHLGRASGVLPIAMLVCAYPLAAMLKKAQGRKILKAGSSLALAVVLIAIGINTWQRYFNAYRIGYEQNSQAHSAGAKVANDFIQAGGLRSNILFLGWQHGWDYRALALLLGDHKWKNVIDTSQMNNFQLLNRLEKLKNISNQKLLLFGGSEAKQIAELIRVSYPTAILERHTVQTSRLQEFWSALVR